MAQEVPVTVLQHNDRTLEFDLSSDDLSFSLANKSIQFLVKLYKSDDDSLAIIDLSSDDAEEIEITDEAALKFKVKLRGSMLARAGTMFYRADVLDPAVNPPYRNTGLYGPFQVEDV
jgi:hypothetical protein